MKLVILYLIIVYELVTMYMIAVSIFMVNECVYSNASRCCSCILFWPLSI
jgi:hypothetical protein